MRGYWQIDRIADRFGKELIVTYGSQQVASRWAIESIDTPEGASVEYDYTDHLLTSISYPDGSTSTFTTTYNSDSNCSKVEFHDLVAEPKHRHKSIYLSCSAGVASGYHDDNAGENQSGPPSYTVASINHIRLVVNGEEEIVYVSFSYFEPGKASRDAYVYEGGGRMKVVHEYHEGFFAEFGVGFLKTGWQIETDSTGFSVSGDLEDFSSSYAANFQSGSINSEMRPGGKLIEYEFDLQGYPIYAVHDDQTFESFCYDSEHRIIRRRDRIGGVTKFVYDSQGRLLERHVGLTDAPGNPGVVDAYTGQITYDRCGSNDVQTSAYAIDQWQYNLDGTLSASIDPLGRQTDFAYDTNGYLVKVTAPAISPNATRSETAFSYNSYGQLSSQTDALGHTIAYFYDSMGRKFKTLYDDGTSETIVFETTGDNTGLVSKRIDRQGLVTSYEYDGADRLTRVLESVAFVDGGGVETPTPVGFAVEKTIQYWPQTDKPMIVRQAGKLTTYRYDYQGRLTDRTIHPQVEVKLTSQSIYDSVGKVFCTVAPSGCRTYYVYDATDGRIIRTVSGLVPEFVVTDRQALLTLTRDTAPNAEYLIVDILHDSIGRVKKQIDPRGIESEFEYDAVGRQVVRIVAVTSPFETRTETDYDAANNVVEARSPRYFDSNDTLGHEKAKETWTYNGLGQVATHTEAPGTAEAATESFVYDLLGRQIERTDFAGKVWTTHYEDCCGQVMASENPLGDGSIVRKDAVGRTIHQVAVEDYTAHTSSLDDPVNAKTLREVTTKYDGRGRPVARTTWIVARGMVDATDPPIAGLGGISAADGLTEQYLYDDDLTDGVGLDNTTGVTPLIGSTAVSLSAAITKLAATEANGGAGVTFAANATGSARVTISPEGEVRYAISDGSGRGVMSGMLKPSDSSLITWNCSVHDETTTISGFGTVLVSKSVNALGKVSQQYSDGAGRTIQSLDALGKITSYEYDAAGNQLKVRDPNGVGQDCTYDALGRDLTCTDTSSAVVSSSYDAEGNKIASTDAKSETTTYAFDARGRQVKQTDRLGGETEFAYSATGNLLSLTDAEDQVTSYTYDDAGTKLTETYPDHVPSSTPGQAGYGIVSFTPDATGRTKVRSDQQGDTCTYAYDLAGRLLNKVYAANASGPLTGQGHTDTFTYDDASRMLTAVSGRYSNTVTYTYDDAGRKATEALTFGGQTYTTTTDYDLAGQVSGYTYPDGTAVGRTYTDRGQLATLSYASTTVDTRTYDDGGRMTGSAYNNGVSEARTYNTDNTLASITHSGAAVGNYTYGWDANKNKTSEAISGTLSGYGFAVGSSGYDDEDRLVNWERSDNNLDQAWNLSLVGDWNSFTENASTQARTHGPSHEMLTVASQSVTHDTKGNTTSIPAVLRPGTDPLAMKWDFENKLIGADIDNDATDDVTYQWDALLRRVGRDDGTTATVYVQNGQQTVADYTSGTAASSPTYNYVYASYIDEPVLRGGTGGLRYYHRGQQYSITALTDGGGNVTERYAYDAYGTPTITDATGSVQTTSAENNRCLYTGREYDEALALYHYRARMYHHGRFLSRDMVGFVDGMSLYLSYFGLANQDPSGNTILGFVGCDLNDPVRERMNPVVNVSNCTRRCVQEHEASHVKDFTPCCQRAKAAYQAAAGDVLLMNLYRDQWNDYARSWRDYTECKAYGVSRRCAEKHLERRHCPCPPNGDAACCNALKSILDISIEKEILHCGRMTGGLPCPF